MMHEMAITVADSNELFNRKNFTVKKNLFERGIDIQDNILCRILERNKNDLSQWELTGKFFFMKVDNVVDRANDEITIDYELN